MIRSMTGFGRCEAGDGTQKITVEIKSVNHRYQDITIKMPKKLNCFESAVRSLLKAYIQRGKLDIFIAYEDCAENKILLKYNKEIAKEYVKYMRQMAEDFALPLELDASKLCACPEVLLMEAQEIDQEQLWQLLEQAIKEAAEQFVDTRIREGEQLWKDLMGKLDQMSDYVDLIQQRAPQILTEYRRRLSDKMHELLGDTQIDESRLLTEVAIFADKICTDEEIVRLKSHINNMRDTFQMEGSVGKNLDFIAQEMNREANTILSKANDIEVSKIAINLRATIEKVREQVQNIE
ncbi:MAG: YicC family protein [Lachnospiraceae bacterium]|nr:YicC family protein [Lachnospiraceae bacterium]